VDRPSSAAEHLDWLREAGFAEVDVAWMYAGHAIFTARRPG
jgi:tRNA (cmo5U34)-methyltransferase